MPCRRGVAAKLRTFGGFFGRGSAMHGRYALSSSIKKTLCVIVAAVALVNAGWLLPSYNVRMQPEGTLSGPQIAHPFPDVRLNLRSGWQMISGPAVYSLLDIPQPANGGPRIIVMPENEAWVAVLSREDSGYVPLSLDAFSASQVRRAAYSISPPDLLGDLRRVGRIGRLNGWIDQPSLDINAKTARFLAKAIGDEEFAYGRGLLFGRSGCVGIRYFGSAYGSIEENRSPLDSLLSSLYFTEGNAYDDHHMGDRATKITPERLLIGTDAGPMRFVPKSNVMNLIWFCLGSTLLMALYRWVITRARS